MLHGANLGPTGARDQLITEGERLRESGGHLSARSWVSLDRADLLVLDDFGLRTLRGPEAEDFCEVIAGRYERVSTLVTSNRNYQEWLEAFGENPLLASAALDRLAHRAHLLTITGSSYRAQDRPRSQTRAKTPNS